MEILLTNDDGIDAVGIRVLYERLSEVADVTVVAPIDDQSAVGRQLSRDIELLERERGYAVEGTPADCVVTGLKALEIDPDLVVSGCNQGAKLGEYVLGRSGTVSAAVEAAFFGVPAIAASVYVPGGDDWRNQALSSAEFDHATGATRFLVEETVATDVFDHVDYLNVNAPLAAGEAAPMRVTTPSTWYGMDAEREGDEIRLQDHIWERMTPADVPDPVGTDRRAVVDGEVSVSPLAAPHADAPAGALDGIAKRYEN